MKREWGRGGKDDGNAGRSYKNERQKKRHSALTIQNYQKIYICMHEYERRGRDVDEDVGVPFIISM